MESISKRASPVRGSGYPSNRATRAWS